MGEGEDQVRAGENNRPKSDEIREDIDRTRMELEETVDAIGERLHPSNIAQEGWRKVKMSSEAGATRVARIAREHPIPIGLIGVGVTWLMIERARRSRWESAELLDEDYADVASAAATEYGSTEYAAEEGRGRVRRMMANTREKVGEAAGRVSQGASGAARRVSDAASQAGRRVGDLAGSVKERAVGLGHRTTEGVQRARQGYWDLVERRPLAAGVATLAAGVLIGLLIPSTRREDEWMGETRDQLLRGARERSRETLEKTKEVARSAADAAQEAARSEAQRQNLTGGQSLT